MSFKRAKVVMLPAPNKKAILSLRELGDCILYAKDFLTEYFDNDVNHTAQNLYITTNEKIKAGDWVTNGVSVWKFVDELVTIDYRKIIATTDKLLITSNEFLWGYRLPSPSESFIRKFMESYNYERTPKTKWLPITDILVEYETITNTSGHTKKELKENAIIEERLKVDSNNTITIKKLKQTFNREELDKILLDVMNLGMSLRQDQLSGHDQRSGNEVLEEYKNENL
jgi:hypothetical protein